MLLLFSDRADRFLFLRRLRQDSFKVLYCMHRSCEIESMDQQTMYDFAFADMEPEDIEQAKENLNG
jgi:hypothetical protein